MVDREALFEIATLKAQEMRAHEEAEKALAEGDPIKAAALAQIEAEKAPKPSLCIRLREMLRTLWRRSRLRALLMRGNSHDKQPALPEPTQED